MLGGGLNLEPQIHRANTVTMPPSTLVEYFYTFNHSFGGKSGFFFKCLNLCAVVCKQIMHF